VFRVLFRDTGGDQLARNSAPISWDVIVPEVHYRQAASVYGRSFSIVTNFSAGFSGAISTRNEPPPSRARSA